MNNIKNEAKAALLQAENGKPVYINWSEEGGGEVYRLNYDWYVLFSIPQYGGESSYEETFHKNDIDKLIDLAFTWT